MAENAAEAAPGEAAGNRPKFGLFIATFAIAIVFVVGVGIYFTTRSYASPVGTEVAKRIGYVTYKGKRVPHVVLRFNTYPDSTGVIKGRDIHPNGNPSWPSYGPTNQFQVPADAEVTVIVHQYDSGGSLNNPWFAKVRGTVGGTEVLNGKTVRGISPNDVGHTFTVRGTPGTDPGFFVSVPLEAVGGNNQTDTGQHNTIVFSFISGTKGLYGWNCEFPCGSTIAGFGGPMSDWGFMQGYLHVV